MSDTNLKKIPPPNMESNALSNSPITNISRKRRMAHEMEGNMKHTVVFDSESEQGAQPNCEQDIEVANEGKRPCDITL